MNIIWTTGGGIYGEKDAYNIPFYGSLNERPYQFCIINETLRCDPYLGPYAPASKDGHSLYVGIVYDKNNNHIYTTKSHLSLKRAKRDLENLLDSLNECDALV